MITIPNCCKKSYKKEKVCFIERDEQSISINGLNEFTVDATLYIHDDPNTTPTFLKKMAKKIIAKYKNGVGYVETEWKGDAELLVGDRVLAQSQHEKVAHEYEVMSNEISLDSSGYRQTTKGRAIIEENNSTKVSKIRIDSNNAFSFGLPILSRTMVNQVKIEFYVLIDATDEFDSDVIEVRRRDCVFDKNDANKFVVEAELKKVYCSIESIRIVWDREKFAGVLTLDKVINATANSIVLEISATRNDFENFKIVINPDI